MGNIYDSVMPWLIFVLIVIFLIGILLDLTRFLGRFRQSTMADQATDWTEEKKDHEVKDDWTTVDRRTRRLNGPTNEEWAAIVERRRQR